MASKLVFSMRFTSKEPPDTLPSISSASTSRKKLLESISCENTTPVRRVPFSSRINFGGLVGSPGGLNAMGLWKFLCKSGLLFPRRKVTGPFPSSSATNCPITVPIATYSDISRSPKVRRFWGGRFSFRTTTNSASTEAPDSSLACTLMF